MRGRGAALVIGMKAGENRANQQAAAQQQAAAEGAAQQKAATEAAAAQAAPAPAAAAADPTEQLKKLAELHDAGVLTDEEFAASKKKALGI
jgi:hypothetical protein